MGNVDIPATEPAATPEPESGTKEKNVEQQRVALRAAPSLEDVDDEARRRRKARNVSFEIPAENEGVGLARRLYRAISARVESTVWLNCILSRLTYAFRCRPKRRVQYSRPLARVSRRRWLQSTLGNETHLLKSCWPVPQTERSFLPAIPVAERRDERYVQRTHVANGAFGRVYRVRDTGSEPAAIDRWYALKILSKSNIILSNAVQQVRDEVSIQTVCGHHPFIVRCVDFWQSRTSIFLLSTFYANGELFQRLKSFTPALVQLYVAELALAIDFLHNAGIIYRDLKPENILLDDRYHLKLIDFGLSRWLSVGNRTATICGTVQYMGTRSKRFYIQ